MIAYYLRQFNFREKKISVRKIVNKIYKRIHWKYLNVPSIFLNKNPYYKNCSIGDYTYGSPDGSPLLIYANPNAKLTIGKFCSIGGNVIIFLGGTNHRFDWVTTYPFGAFFPEANQISAFANERLDVTIGNDVWIGEGATILSGVTIGNGCVIGTKSVVTKDVQPYTIVAGNPASVRSKRFNDDIIDKLEKLQWWNWEISEILKNKHLILNEPQELLNEMSS